MYLFGSQATGNARADSDVDIAILATRALNPVERWELSHQLAKTVDHDVDLIDLLQASTVLKMESVQISFVALIRISDHDRYLTQ
ncbi:type VII toxin-antitoxin system MntA family adenylyltransferase antitoxin [Pectobacterium polaris]|uniref:type VII toxin-antitoxin system MntA family adenylyltransferase antitoxin n=1 Tax=Pectobacterium polaris TaxID=2042057 RepID=UPI0035BF9407